ncbi:hypothetical protein QBC39DRAFT_372675 [Podospora conica]|nr:hypothetical protein QBC39DRAFT_372675 [Schizothecium conicum]
MPCSNTRTITMLAFAVVTLSLGVLVLLSLRLRHRRLHRDTPSPRSDETLPPYHDADPEKHSTSPPPHLPTSVTAGDQDKIGRDQWVLRLTRHVFGERHGKRYNVLVINDDLQYCFSPHGVVEEFNVVYQDTRHKVPYRVVVFARGELINMGDGGDINWDWMGNFVRHNNAQLSFSPCAAGEEYQQDAWVAKVD